MLASPLRYVLVVDVHAYKIIWVTESKTGTSRLCLLAAGHRSSADSASHSFLRKLLLNMHTRSFRHSEISFLHVLVQTLDDNSDALHMRIEEWSHRSSTSATMWMTLLNHCKGFLDDPEHKMDIVPCSTLSLGSR